VDGGLEHLPGEQAALLAVRGEAGAVELEHVLGREMLYVVDVLADHFFQQHRGGRLADHAALAGEVAVADAAGFVEGELDADDIAAEGIVVFVNVGRGRQMATMERVLVVVEDMFLIQLFFVDSHGQAGQTGRATLCRRVLCPVYEPVPQATRVLASLGEMELIETPAKTPSRGAR
jgi:hypothetical protein